MSLDDQSAELLDDGAPIDGSTGLVLGPAESDSAFFRRRALEEARSAQQATCPRAASSHLYLSAVYSEKVRREMEASIELDRLLSRLC